MSVCPDHNWDTYSYNTDDGPVIVGFHTQSNRIDQSQYPFCARVIIPIKSPNQNGFPEQDEAQVLWNMEDQLVEDLDVEAVPCLLLGRLTHGGVRELVFQVGDYEPFRPPVGRWMAEHDAYETDVSEHDGWDFFFESVWPSETSWLMIMDRRVVENLREAGSDPLKPHSLEFVFRGDESKLRLMESALMDRGYTLIAMSANEGRLIMARSLPLDLGMIFEESVSHHDHCRDLGIEYDGWGAAVVS
tara:strand:- start:125 stop:859 length:735 start_codon:yes stop_codon:yes gene_type:complete